MIPFPSRTNSRRLFLATLILASAGSALTGCDSDEISIDDLPAEVERRLCARAVACGGAESQASCESTAYVAESASVMTLVAAVKRGTVAYDGESASECLDAFTANDCASLGAEPAACGNIFRGRVPAGGVCVTSEECVGGGRCLEPDTCTAACCVGSCEAVAPPAAIGASCDFFVSNPCVEGAFCSLENVCTALLPLGAACDLSDACRDPGAYCVDRPDGSGRVCTLRPTEPGAACIPNLNELCARDDERCNAATSLCTKVAPLGAACQGSNDCVGYAYCDMTTGTCAARPTVGQACDYNTGVYCLGDIPCSNNVCTAPTPGVACVP